MRMKFTSYLCVSMLVLLGVCGGVFAFTGFNLLLFLCMNEQFIYRTVLAVSAVAALYTFYAMIAFKPFKGLK